MVALNLPALSAGDRRQMQQLGVDTLPVLIRNTGPDGWRAFLDFFGATIENGNTRKAYLGAVCAFLAECDAAGIKELAAIEPFMVGAYVDHRKRSGDSKSTIKQKLSAVRKFFDFLVVRQVLARNPALSVRGPKLRIRKGKSPVLTLEQLQQLVDAIDRSTIVGKRDYAWLVLAATSWCRVGALANLTIDDYEHSGKRSFIHVEEKGGKVDQMPVHHKAQEALDELIAATSIGSDKNSPIFQSVGKGRGGSYTGRPLAPNMVWEMVRRRARRAGLPSKLCCHSFRATGITLYLSAGGNLERAQKRAHHADSRTTKLYDHSDYDVTLEDVELVQF